MKKLLVTIPFYNEEKNLKKLLSRIPKKKKFDICFINDGSTDKSSKLISQKYKLINHITNKGYGAAVISGLKYAKKKKYDFMCVFPGDNQRKFKDINKLYKQLELDNSYDIIIGSKFHLLKTIPFQRKFGNYFFSLISKIWGNRVKDIMSGFKIYKVNKIFVIKDKLPKNYSLDVCLNYISNKKKFKMKEINVFCNYKKQTSKMTNIVIVSLNILYDLINTAVNYKK